MVLAASNRHFDIPSLLDEIRDEVTVPEESVSVGDRDIIFSRFLGRGSTPFSSRVYLADDGLHVIKIYPPGSRLPDYDRWVSRYYRENWLEGIPHVPEMLGDPTVLPLAVGDHQAGSIVVVKEYVEGMRPDEFTPEILARLGWTLDQLEAEGQPLLDHVKSLHAEGRFEKWLNVRGVDHSEWGTPETGRWVHQGDLKAANFVYTKEGWVLFDP